MLSSRFVVAICHNSQTRHIQFVPPLSQAFFANRLSICFEKPYLAILCWALTVCRFLSAVVLNMVQGGRHIVAPHTWAIVMIVGYFIEAAVDLIVATSLCYFLIKSRRNSVHKRSVAVQVTRPRSDGFFRTIKLLDKLIAMTIRELS